MTNDEIKLAIAHEMKTISKKVELIQSTGTDEVIDILAYVKGIEKSFHVWRFYYRNTVRGKTFSTVLAVQNK